MPDAESRHWRPVPERVSRQHLQAMVVREPHLVVEDQLGRTLVARLPDRARWVVGRDPACDLVIDWDASVSRSHAVIERLGTVVTVEDSGVSRNGTVVGGRRTQGRVLLTDAAQIELGYTRLLVRLAATGTAAVTTIGVTGRDERTSPTFSPAEHRVLLAMVDARRTHDRTPTNRELGEALGIGAETVKSHLGSIMRRLQGAGVPAPIDRDRVVELALEGLLAPPGPSEPSAAEGSAEERTGSTQDAG